MSLFNESDWQNSSDITLTASEQGGTILLPGFVAFLDCAELGQVDDYAPRYQVSFRVPKGNEHMPKFFAICDRVISKVWQEKAGNVGEMIWGGLDAGVGTDQSLVSMQDGDLYQPEYNAGHWWLKPTRREDAGRPTIIGRDGTPVYAPNTADAEEGLILGELIGDENEVPKQNDQVVVLFRAWGQSKRNRLNFTLEGIRLVKRGAPGQRAIASQKAALSMLGGDALPALGAGDSDQDAGVAPVPTAAPRKKTAAKKASKKKTAAKKAGSVFRRGR